MSELIVSIHIPKTGGVSFREVLAELAEGHLVQDYADRPLAPASLGRRLRERLRRVRLPPGTRVVHGHFIASKYWSRHPDARFVTWLREPIERLVSHYHYWLREPDPENPTCRRLLEERLTLGEFAALPELRDVQARFLSGLPIEAFAFVGLTERYEEGMELFGRLFGLEPGVQAARRNTNPERKGERYELEPGLRSSLEALNRADLALYARARARYEGLRAAAASG